MSSDTPTTTPVFCALDGQSGLRSDATAGLEPVRVRVHSVALAEMARRSFNGLATDLERNRGVWIVLFGLVYLFSVALHGARRFWYDELITFHMAQLPDMATVWRALTEGVDLNPPLFYAVTRAAESLFGSSEFVVRLPAIAGFFVMSSCLYVFVARRAGPCYGFAAMVCPWVTGAFDYAAEARAYGMMLGFCGVALVAWQKINERERRSVMLALFSAALAGALLTHCYAVLLLVPFGMGALVRDWHQRHINWAVWIGLAIPLSVILLYLPLLAASKPYAVDNPIFRPDLFSVSKFYDFLLSPGLWPLLTGAALIAVAAARTRERILRETWPIHELALAAGFLLVPVLAVLLAFFVSHVFMLRYGLASVLGVAILIPAGAGMLTGNSRAVGAALAILMAGWSAASTGGWVYTLLNAPSDDALLGKVAFEQVRPDLPIVVSSGLLFLPLDHYAAPSVAARLCYLMDEKIARHMTGSDVFEKGYPLFRRWFPMHGSLENYRPFLASHRKFLVYGYASFELDWLIPKLIQDGAKLVYLGQGGPQKQRTVLFEVESPPQGSAQVH